MPDSPLIGESSGIVVTNDIPMPSALKLEEQLETDLHSGILPGMVPPGPPPAAPPNIIFRLSLAVVIRLSLFHLLMQVKQTMKTSAQKDQGLVMII